ncbi:MAG: VanZ family protein [Acidobacteria bacterium]|nr:VanZ family protein [Acidobacteriota bacterium]
MTVRKLQFIVLMVAFGILGLMPDPATVAVTGADLIAHMLGWVLGAISGRYAFPRVKATILGAALAGYSLLIEAAQILVPTRSFELLDLVANGVGVIFGMVIMSRVQLER